MREAVTLLRAYLSARYWLRFKTRAALERHQQRRLRRFQDSVLRRSPYYRGWADGDLAAIPPIDKTGMRAHFDAINTAGIRWGEALALAVRAEETRDFAPLLNGVSVGLSTGTSGQRGLFLASAHERALWAGTILGRMLPRSLFGAHRIAFLLRADNRLYQTAGGKGRIKFRFFDLTRPIEEHLPALDAYRPTTLIAPAQVLRLLAEAQADWRLQIRPERVISVAEVLDADDRARIEAVFGPVLHEVYQCTEGFLGATCNHRRLHLNEAHLHIEPDWIDAAHTRFAPIVTDFNRSTQPIVRYRLDDILEIDDAPCPCGNPERVLRRVCGRCDDMLRLPAQDGGVVRIMPDFVSRALVGADERIRDFRVTQTAENALSVALDGPADSAVQARAALLALAARCGAVPPAIAFVPYGGADLLRKRRRIVCTLAKEVS